MVYELKFYVSTPVILEAPLHLDGLLSSTHPYATQRGTSLSKYSSITEIKSAPLCIDSARIDDARVWCCSAGRFDPNAQDFYSEAFIKATSDSDLYYLHLVHAPRSGVTKDIMQTIRGKVCEYVTFLFSSSNPYEVSRAAKRVRALGSFRRMGYGAVKSFELNETSKDWRECLIYNGCANRNLPAELIQTTCDRLVCTAPPYWLPDNLMPGVPFGEECELKDEIYLKIMKRRSSAAAGG